VLTTEVEVDPDLEITGLQKHLDGGPVLLFNRVKGKPHARAITNLLADMNVVDKLFGFETPIDRTKKIARAMREPLKPVEVSRREAPCQEEVLTDDLDVNKYITAIRHTALESELTIGSGISCVVGDYFKGGSHIGYNRMNFRWGNVGTFQASPGSHMWQIITAHYKDEKPVPLTMCFGVPPACTLVAGGGFDYVIVPKG
jgi:4-hydroxy-3-polyprenylbenzoate decarboxylase